MPPAGDRDGEPASPGLQQGSALILKRVGPSLQSRDRRVQAGVHVVESRQVRCQMHELAPFRVQATLGRRQYKAIRSQKRINIRYQMARQPRRIAAAGD
jgi:hypothetical protein